jgi:hypothetical protein
VRQAARQISRRQWIGAVASSPLVFGGSIDPAKRKLEPRDEAARDPELWQLLKNLRSIVEKREERPLLAGIGQTFRVEIAAGKGRSSFIKFWRTGAPESEVWTVLSRLLTIGGTFYSPTLFAIPYVYTHFPIDLDPLSHVVALQENVNAHHDSRPDSTVAAVLSFDIVPTQQAFQTPVWLSRVDWVRVAVAGRPAFVSSRQVWSPAGHRLFFEKRRGRWEWISLVCAD